MQITVLGHQVTCGQNHTGFGETRKGKMVPWVVRSRRNSPPSFTVSKEDSERGRDSTPIFTPVKQNKKHIHIQN